MLTTFEGFINENNQNNISNLIDFTNLSDDASIDDIKQLCETADENNFYTVCILPKYVATASAFLENTNVKICTVISFPKGTDSTKNKVVEANDCITAGAEEIDMVMDYKLLQTLTSENEEEYNEGYEKLVNDIKSVAKNCHKNGVILKVIIETGALTYDQIRIACDVCIDAGADFVKTSTGFLKNDDTLEQKLQKVKFMKKILPDYMNIKVSGGIRTYEDATKFTPYVNRIGTSSTLSQNNINSNETY